MLRWLTAAASMLLLGACASTTATTAPSAAPIAASPAEARAPVTILVSIDGFRPDYLHKGNSPRIDALARGGASASMRPSFPSKTFPNHWTIVTGARPDRNGIVANKMEDPTRPGESFTMATDDPFWWNAVPPIWIDAEKAGVRTATMFWPGSNIAWGGTRATEWPNAITGGTRPRDWQQFNHDVSAEQRVNAVLDWLRRPADIRPAFVTLYFDTVDTAGHSYGPDDSRTAAAVADIDTSIGMLIDGLNALDQSANLVLVSDHGMARIDDQHVIALDKIVDATGYRLIESGSYASFDPLPGKEAVVAKALLKQHPHMRCWRKSEIPPQFHYGSNPRIPPLFCLADIGWSINASAPKAPFVGGAHGYDNMAPEMAALFIANGPAFKPGSTLQPFDNVDIYPMLARLIGIAPHASDGTASTFDPVLTGAK